MLSMTTHPRRLGIVGSKRGLRLCHLHRERWGVGRDQRLSYGDLFADCGRNSCDLAGDGEIEVRLLSGLERAAGRDRLPHS